MSDSKMPHFLAIANAVSLLSPVIILTVIPALWHLEIDSATVPLRGSSMPIKPYRMYFDESSFSNGSLITTPSVITSKSTL